MSDPTREKAEEAIRLAYAEGFADAREDAASVSTDWGDVEPHWFQSQSFRAAATLTAQSAVLTQERDDARRLLDEAVDGAWDEVLRVVQRAWPEPQTYGDCPTELIARVIDERDEWHQKHHLQVESHLAETRRMLAELDKAETERDELLRRTGCVCRCCDHGEGSDCGCECHANGRCSFGG